jgi:hypothetical protein
MTSDGSMFHGLQIGVGRKKAWLNSGNILAFAWRNCGKP